MGCCPSVAIDISKASLQSCAREILLVAAWVVAPLLPLTFPKLLSTSRRHHPQLLQLHCQQEEQHYFLAVACCAALQEKLSRPMQVLGPFDHRTRQSHLQLQPCLHLLLQQELESFQWHLTAYLLMVLSADGNFLHLFHSKFL